MKTGFLLIDKPEGPTSHDIVDQLRKILDLRRIGHAGTLDPFASGLLILCIGAATRLSEYLLKQDKTYLFTLRLGATSDSYDRTGKISPSPEKIQMEEIQPEEIKRILEEFTGCLEQKPPVYSAVKIRGKRSYEYAREGKPVDIKSRSITVQSLSLLESHYPYLFLAARVSSGTYIRTLGHDIGQRLGLGAYVQNLRRTAIGSCDVRDALSLEPVIMAGEEIRERIKTIKEMFAHWPRLVLEDAELEKIRNGNPIMMPSRITLLRKEENVLILDHQGREWCLAQVGPEGPDWMIKPKKVLTI